MVNVGWYINQQSWILLQYFHCWIKTNMLTLLFRHCIQGYVVLYLVLVIKCSFICSSYLPPHVIDGSNSRTGLNVLLVWCQRRNPARFGKSSDTKPQQSAITLIAARISNHMTSKDKIISNHISSKAWYKIIYPPPKFNGCTVEVWGWKSNFIPHFIMIVII